MLYPCKSGWNPLPSSWDMVHTSTFGLKFGSLSPAVTLKIMSRSPKLNQLIIMSQCYIHANLVKIHPPVHEICKQESHADANADINRIRTKTNMSPSPSVGDIIMQLVMDGTWKWHELKNTYTGSGLRHLGNRHDFLTESGWKVSFSRCFEWKLC